MDQIRPKVLLAYNETNPELYIYKSELEKANLNFVPYFEIDNVSPMDEFDYMAKSIEQAGFRVVTLNINDHFRELLETIEYEKPDVIFNCIELIYGNPRLEMNICGLYELMGIPYTGAPPLTLANCQNKVMAKKLLSAEGVPTPNYAVAETEDAKLDLSHLQFPLIVKPLNEDASVGIENASVVYDEQKLTERVQFVFREFKQPALIEEFILGRELNVAVFGDSDPIILPVSEIDFSSMPENMEKIVSYQAKWDPLHVSYHKTIPICPAPLTDEQLERVSTIALKAFRTMGLRDYARVDMRLKEDGSIFVLEVNPNPDLSEGAGFMRSAEATGKNYSQILGEIVNLALARRSNGKAKKQ